MGINEFINDKNSEIEYLNARQQYAKLVHEAAVTAIDNLDESEITRERKHSEENESADFYVCATSPFLDIGKSGKIAIRSRLAGGNELIRDVQLVAKLTDDSEQVYATISKYDTSTIQYTDPELNHKGADIELFRTISDLSKALATPTSAAA